jgi:ketosteroid isomerase-like protein
VSRENLETARRAVEQWLRGGATLDAIPIEVYADDVEWDFSAYPQIDGPTRGTGVGSLLDVLRAFFNAWESYQAEAGDFLDAGDNVVNVLHETAGTGGVVVKRHLFQVWTFRDGLIVKWRTFDTRGPALEAAGLPE